MKRFTFTIHARKGDLYQTLEVPAYRLDEKPEHRGLRLVLHKSLSGNITRGRWTVAEESTSVSVGRGKTKALATAHAENVLRSKTPEQVKGALEFAKTALAIIKAENRIEMLDNLSQPAV